MCEHITTCLEYLFYLWATLVWMISNYGFDSSNGPHLSVRKGELNQEHNHLVIVVLARQITNSSNENLKTYRRNSKIVTKICNSIKLKWNYFSKTNTRNDRGNPLCSFLIRSSCIWISVRACIDADNSDQSMDQSMLELYCDRRLTGLLFWGFCALKSMWIMCSDTLDRSAYICRIHGVSKM